MGAILVAGLVGCEDKSKNDQAFNDSAAFASASQKQAAFVIIEESKDGRYAIVDEFPSSKTTIVLRKPDGTERILTKTEIDALVKSEEVKIDNGTSGLTNPNSAEASSGMGLGGVLMSSIAGAMLGSYIGNKLFGNQNYQNQKKHNINLLQHTVNQKVHLAKLIVQQVNLHQLLKKVDSLEIEVLLVLNLDLLSLEVRK